MCFPGFIVKWIIKTKSLFLFFWLLRFTTFVYLVDVQNIVISQECAEHIPLATSTIGSPVLKNSLYPMLSTYVNVLLGYGRLSIVKTKKLFQIKLNNNEWKLPKLISGIIFCFLYHCSPLWRSAVFSINTVQYIANHAECDVHLLSDSSLGIKCYKGLMEIRSIYWNYIHVDSLL